MIFQKDLLSETVIKLTLNSVTTYYDLFSIMGVSSIDNTTYFAGKYVIWKHPKIGSQRKQTLLWIRIKI